MKMILMLVLYYIFVCFAALSCAFTPVQLARSYSKSSTVLLDGSNLPWETPLDMALEETLLKMHLSLQTDADPEVALAKVQGYTQSFPFAAVLPVQPLQYLPTHDGGVDVLFLRKKTQEKSSIDGGMRFFVSPSPEGDGIEVEVKRNSKGQSVSKMFSEKIVVQAYCDGMAGKEDTRTGKAPVDFVSISSVFHKWM